jgi:hypothetical protein
MNKENYYQVMKLVPQAINGDARAAAMLWRELAANASDANDNDIRRWVQHVALRLVDNVCKWSCLRTKTLRSGPTSA